MPDKYSGGTSHVVSSGWRRQIEFPLVVCGGVFIFVLMGLSVFDALLRSFVNKPIYGANDYIQILLSFSVTLSFPLCVMAGRLIDIDTIVLLLPKSLQKVIHWIVSFMGITVLSYISWRAFVNGLESATFAETTLLLQIPFGPSYYAVSFGCGLSAMVLLMGALKNDS
jgi:TRAP-type C4-dicarboxylate transport system permease small subunit